MRNMRHQLLFALESCKRIGTSKRQYRLDHPGNKTRGYVFSIESYKKIKSEIKSFAKFMRENYPEIQMAVDINNKHFQSYLNTRLGNWTRRTADTKVDTLKSIDAIINRVWGIDRDKFCVIVPDGTRAYEIRKGAMEQYDYDAILSQLVSKHTNSQACIAIQITDKLGLRVKEIASLDYRNIDLNNKVVTVSEGVKNGRKRKVPIREEDTLFFAEIVKKSEDHYQRTENPYVTRGVHQDSINKMIRIAMAELDLSDKYANTNHAVRKKYAKDTMKLLLDQGYSRESAWEKVYSYLGHSSDRTALRKVYLGLK